jgi:hypothetical protein
MLSPSGATELNLMRIGQRIGRPLRACLAGILHSRGCAPRCGASPRAIVPVAPQAPAQITRETPEEMTQLFLMYISSPLTSVNKKILWQMRF